jgi:hypothetical protein
MYDILCCMMCHVLSCVMFIQYVQYNICNIYAQYIYGMEYTVSAQDEVNCN